MRRLLFVSCVALLLLAGCGPKGGGSEYAGTVRAIDLQVQVNDGQATVIFKKRGEGAIAGYNIYISKQPLVEVYPGTSTDPDMEPWNTTPFPGDTNPEDGVERYVAEGLENGVRYYVSVRVVYPDRTVSKPTREIEVVCGPRREITLSIRYQSDQDGFSFERNEYVRADGTNNDFYFFSKDGVDRLASPIRLNGFLRDNKFLVLPYRGDLSDVEERLKESGVVATDDHVNVRVDDWVLIQTPEGRQALVNVQGFDSDGEDRRARLFIAYPILSGHSLP